MTEPGEPRIVVGWAARAVPLPARAVIATGAAAKALARRIAALADEQLRVLAAVAGDDVLVVLGEASALPWVDGVAYLGCDPAAPALLLPTAQEPTVPAALLEAAVRKRVPGASPVAVLPAPARLVPCGAARSVDRARLAAWLDGALAGVSPEGAR